MYQLFIHLTFVKIIEGKNDYSPILLLSMQTLNNFQGPNIRVATYKPKNSDSSIDKYIQSL